MPIYNRHCNECDELFEVVCKISEKETHQPECPYCGSNDGDWRPTACATSIRPERFSANSKNNKAKGFQEVIQKVQERNKRTEISKR